MPRSLDILTESTAMSSRSTQRLAARTTGWPENAAFDAASTLDSLTIDADGTVTVHATEHPGRQLLQRLVAKLVPGIENPAQREVETGR